MARHGRFPFNHLPAFVFEEFVAFIRFLPRAFQWPTGLEAEDN
jgi:hypothetical protein